MDSNSVVAWLRAALPAITSGLAAADTRGAYLWQTERGNLLMGRETSGRPTRRRRRAELLQREGRAIAARAAGSPPTGAAEVVTERYFVRKWRGASDGRAGWKGVLFRRLLLLAAAAVYVHVVWLAALLGWLGYKHGVLRYAPVLGKKVHRVLTPALWAVSIAAIAVLVLVGVVPLGLGELLWDLPMRHAPVRMLGPTVIEWALVSTAAAPAVTARMIEAWGWAAAPEVAKAARNKDGSFRKVRDSEKTTVQVHRRAEPAKPEVVVMRRKSAAPAMPGASEAPARVVAKPAPEPAPASRWELPPLFTAPEPKAASEPVREQAPAPTAHRRPRPPKPSVGVPADEAPLFGVEPDKEDDPAAEAAIENTDNEAGERE